MIPHACHAEHPGETHRFAYLERIGYWLLPGVQVQEDASCRSAQERVQGPDHESVEREPLVVPAGAAVVVNGSELRLEGPGLALDLEELFPDLPPGHSGRVQIAWGSVTLELQVRRPHAVHPKWVVRAGSGRLPPPLDDLCEPNDTPEEAWPLEAPSSAGAPQVLPLVLRAGDADVFSLDDLPCLRRYRVRLREAPTALRLEAVRGGEATGGELRFETPRPAPAPIFRVRGGAARADYVLELQDLGPLEDDPHEPNDALAQAKPLGPGTYSLRAFDADWFSAEVPALHAARLRLRAFGREASSLNQAFRARFEGTVATPQVNWAHERVYELRGACARARRLEFGLDLAGSPAPYEVELVFQRLSREELIATGLRLRGAGRFTAAAELYQALGQAEDRLVAARCYLHGGALDQAARILETLSRQPGLPASTQHAALRRLTQLRAGERPTLLRLLEASALLERSVLTHDPSLARAALQRTAHLASPRASALRLLHQSLEQKAQLAAAEGSR